jgi:hypothetical protein
VRHAADAFRSVHLEWTQNLDQNGFFKSADDLKAMYDAPTSLLQQGSELPYCQGWVTAPRTLTWRCG